MKSVKQMLIDFYTKWYNWEITREHEYLVLTFIIGFGIAALFVFNSAIMFVLVALVAFYRYWLGPKLVARQDVATKDE